MPEKEERRVYAVGKEMEAAGRTRGGDALTLGRRAGEQVQTGEGPVRNRECLTAQGRRAGPTDASEGVPPSLARARFCEELEDSRRVRTRRIAERG